MVSRVTHIICTVPSNYPDAAAQGALVCVPSGPSGTAGMDRQPCRYFSNYSRGWGRGSGLWGSGLLEGLCLSEHPAPH